MIKAPKKTVPFGDDRGHARRWAGWEDTVLRNWFGVRTHGPNQGKHVPLTEREWNLVIEDHLKGRRSQAQVRARITALNKALKISLLVDGFIPRDKVQAYRDRALGEHRIRVPRFRPRIKGRSYRGENELPIAGQPL